MRALQVQGVRNLDEKMREELFLSGKFCNENGHWLEWGAATMDSSFELIEQYYNCNLCDASWHWKIGMATPELMPT